MNIEHKVIQLIKNFKYDNNISYALQQIKLLYPQEIANKLIKSIINEIDYYLYVKDYLIMYDLAKECFLCKFSNIIQNLNLRDSLDYAILYSLLIKIGAFRINDSINLRKNRILISGLEF